jgi:tRNA (cytidine/uridine-2'-O-)-methyltransferase
MMHIVLVEPEIPQNTGNIARTCAATGAKLHLIKPLGFELSDKYLKRAGLDYWHMMTYEVHESWQAFLDANPGARLHFATTKAPRDYCEAAYGPDDFLVFGKETAGLGEKILVPHADEAIRIPMGDGQRSLNLSNAVAIVVYEALRQNDFFGMR